MLELVFGVVCVGVMVKVANEADQSPLLWGGLTVLATIGAMMFVPWAFARVLMAAAAVLIAMWGYKIATRS